MRIYILADEHSRGKALDAAVKLRACGFEPVHSIGSARERFLLLLRADGVACVDGWNKSKICQALGNACYVMGIKIASVEGWIQYAKSKKNRGELL